MFSPSGCYQADSNVSNHLKRLRESGMIETERRGPLCFYSVATRHQRLVLNLRTALGITESCDPVLSADAWNSQRALRS